MVAVTRLMLRVPVNSKVTIVRVFVPRGRPWSRPLNSARSKRSRRPLPAFTSARICASVMLAGRFENTVDSIGRLVRRPDQDLRLCSIPFHRAEAVELGDGRQAIDVDDLLEVAEYWVTAGLL